ncbi:hypothetical protein [Nocardioides alkalitolerans]|uniref:hypothetical protein n=1 Tax=Nocardioides alkalitolerans TaxID=281714 RepID=UPI001B7FC705|nr:hypothetical protein [Nocardioides alkalitolerans]
MCLTLLRAGLPDSIPVRSLIPEEVTFPIVLVRRASNWGQWSGHKRFIDSGAVSIQAFCSGIDADSDAAILSEAVRVILYDSINTPVSTTTSNGHLTQVRLLESPRRVTDWASAVGPVQYADLPKGVVRYETVFDLSLRIK